MDQVPEIVERNGICSNGKGTYRLFGFNKDSTMIGTVQKRTINRKKGNRIWVYRRFNGYMYTYFYYCFCVFFMSLLVSTN